MYLSLLFFNKKIGAVILVPQSAQGGCVLEADLQRMWSVCRNRRDPKAVGTRGRLRRGAPRTES